MNIDKLKLRREFVVKYCKSKGWNLLEVNFDEITEIMSQDGWINPVLEK